MLIRFLLQVRDAINDNKHENDIQLFVNIYLIRVHTRSFHDVFEQIGCILSLTRQIFLRPSVDYMAYRNHVQKI